MANRTNPKTQKVQKMADLLRSIDLAKARKLKSELAKLAGLRFAFLEKVCELSNLLQTR